jgi:hypothetical protein
LNRRPNKKDIDNRRYKYNPLCIVRNSIILNLLYYYKIRHTAHSSLE